MKNLRCLSCEEVRALLDAGVPGERCPDVDAHLAACPDCRVEARIRSLAASLAADPPPGFTDGVMRLVRAEHARELRRRSLLRRASAVAAALVLVPVLAVTAPRLARIGKHTAGGAPAEMIMFTAPAAPGGAAAEEHAPETTAAPETRAAAPETTVEETAAVTGSVLAAPREDRGEAPETGEPDGDAAPNSANGASAPDTAAAGNAVDTAEPAPAPEYVTKREPAPAPETTALTVCGIARDPDLDDALRVIAAIAGEDAYETWCAAYAGDAHTAARDAAAAFSISREAFAAMAQKMEIAVSERTLAEIFG